MFFRVSGSKMLKDVFSCLGELNVGKRRIIDVECSSVYIS